MSKKRLTITILIHIIAMYGYAQCVIIGKVKNSGGAPMEMVNVAASPINSPKTFLSSAFTDENGHYKLMVKSDCDSLILRALSIEITPIIIKIPNQSGAYDIVVEDIAYELKEVVVKAKKIYSQGDTINYNVASFLSQNDQALADVLKKMPGITVAESGQVSYQGKPIKKFYIEGLDLMKGHYGIATNNIDPKNITTVQVLENHQDIKALKGLRPEEQASINIRLKEGVKGVFNLIATLGGGYSDEALWNNSAIATYFKRNSQFLATYKGNNTGEDLSQELYSFDNDYYRTSNITDISIPSAPGIDKRFYYFNRSHSATYNNVYRVGKSGEFGINAAYLNDHDTRKNYSSTTNTLPDGTQNVVEEEMNGTSKTNKAYGDITYLLNSDNKYLKEQLKFDWLSTNANSKILADDDDIAQLGKTDAYRLLNKFHLTNRDSKNRGYEIYSIVNLEKRPHSLSVSPNLFSELISGDMLRQDVDYRDFSTENSIGLLSAWKICGISLHPNFFFDYHHNSLTSTLLSTLNDLCLDKLSTGVSADFTWHNRKIDVSLRLPIGYKFFNLKDRLEDVTTDKNRVRIEPQLDILYKINSSHTLSLKSALTYSSPSVQNLYSNYILTSYRQLSAYDVAGLFEGQNLHNSISYKFKNILTMSFAGLDFSWNRQKPDVLYGSYYDGLVERLISQRSNETADMLSVTVNGSQGFDLWRLKIGLSATYNYYESPLLVQDIVTHYTGNSFAVNGDVSLSPFKWLSMSYEGKYYQSATRQKGYERMPWLRTLTNNVTLDFNLQDGLSLRTSFYHYYNNFNDGDKSFLLLNAEARYTIKRFTFTLSCDNLFNRKDYLYSSRSALTDTNSAYNIRPRSILMKIRFRIL